MVWVDAVSDLEYFNANPVYGCYADTVFNPSDINLQAQLGTYFDLTSIALPVINIVKPDGTFIEIGNAYFHVNILSFNLNGVTYYYCNAICHTISAGMIANGCFSIELNATSGTGYNYFHKWTQKFALNDPSFILPQGVAITLPGTGNLAVLCYADQPKNNCNNLYTKFVSFCDCIDSFSGDFFGDGTLILSSGFMWDFVRISWLNCRLKTLPDAIKRTISINNRTQRTEKTTKYMLYADKNLTFPLWKVQEIEAMLLHNHIFLDGKQYQSEGGTPFSQIGVAQGTIYAYRIELSLQDPYEWQVFGCTPPCAAVTYYYPLTF